MQHSFQNLDGLSCWNPLSGKPLRSLSLKAFRCKLLHKLQVCPHQSWRVVVFFRCLGYLSMIMTLWLLLYIYDVLLAFLIVKKTLLTRYSKSSKSWNLYPKRIPTEPQEKDSLVAWNVGFGVCLGSTQVGRFSQAPWPKLFGAKTKHPITSWLDMVTWTQWFVYTPEN